MNLALHPLVRLDAECTINSRLEQ